jgi:hypothetical protein
VWTQELREGFQQLQEAVEPAPEMEPRVAEALALAPSARLSAFLEVGLSHDPQTLTHWVVLTDHGLHGIHAGGLPPPYRRGRPRHQHDVATRGAGEPHPTTTSSLCSAVCLPA